MSQKHDGADHVSVAEQDGPSGNSWLAQVADQEEHDLGIMASFREYPWACVWCVYATWCIILLSFDSQASGSIIGIPQFRKDFGEPFGDDYVLPAYWQSIFNAAPVAS